MGVLPNNITSLTFGNKFNQHIKPDTLPQSLVQLTFGVSYNQPLEVGLLPANLTVLVFGSVFDQSIPKGSLPPNLKSLTFGRVYRQFIKHDVLPPALTYLEFGDSFAQSITPGLLPNSIIKLNAGGACVKPGAFPLSITSLAYSMLCRYTQHFNLGILPSTLQSLTLGHNYFPSMHSGALPDSLTELSFLSRYDLLKDYVTLPASVTKLALLNPRQCKYIQDHPHSIDYVTIIGPQDMDYPGDREWLTKRVRMMQLTVYIDHQRRAKPMNKQFINIIKRLYVNYPAVETFELFVQRDYHNPYLMLIKCRMIDVVEKQVVYTIRLLDKPGLHFGFLSLKPIISITKQVISFVKRFI
ncbi:hypothetical protein SAMD00019534_082470 [Acytostelium subglobosum LB1]|uniref:hypothetical protein n=1 Tax=Acytostelium subglobosum LB1 TaxID=1410327 RepID=UPI00064506FE|nr:hypothetical protein SAMD00019534_082470 [Acytostelium subglobosum LB1]GAM25072.1 hypothetical protein SAMD00019534_082470 [Acytostelium subglobosum LB1]|eukprot:XP_012752161.1 hypothetical protein SAMD00019534_082470 [Acytostelium subglobosum LB1]